MKIKKQALTKEDIYQTGNVVKSGGSIYLVIQLFSGRYSLLDLKSSQVVSAPHDSLKRLANRYHNNDDKVLKAEIIIKEGNHD